MHPMHHQHCDTLTTTTTAPGLGSLAVMAALTLALAACGGGGESGSTPTDGSGSPASNDGADGTASSKIVERELPAGLLRVVDPDGDDALPWDVTLESDRQPEALTAMIGTSWASAQDVVLETLETPGSWRVLELPSNASLAEQDLFLSLRMSDGSVQELRVASATP